MTESVAASCWCNLSAILNIKKRKFYGGCHGFGSLDRDDLIFPNSERSVHLPAPLTFVFLVPPSSSSSFSSSAFLLYPPSSFLFLFIHIFNPGTVPATKMSLSPVSVSHPTPKVTKKQVCFLTPSSSVPIPQLPLTPVPPTPRPSPTESEESLAHSDSSESGTSDFESGGPSTPPAPASDLEYFIPPPSHPAIHFVLSQPNIDLSLSLPEILAQIPPEFLNQPATSPPIRSLKLISHWVPWRIEVFPNAVPNASPQTGTHTGILPCTPLPTATLAFQYSASPPSISAEIFPADADEYYVPPQAPQPQSACVTINDIITTLHSFFRLRVKKDEWAVLSPSAKEVTGRSFYTRLDRLDPRRMEKEKKRGALRLDILPADCTRIYGFFVNNWDAEKAEAVWTTDFGPKA